MFIQFVEIKINLAYEDGGSQQHCRFYLVLGITL